MQVYMGRDEDFGVNLGGPKFRNLGDDEERSKGNKEGTREVAGEPRESRSWNRNSRTGRVLRQLQAG